MTRRTPIDIVDILQSVQAGKLELVVKNGAVLIKDLASGEAVRVPAQAEAEKNEPLTPCDLCIYNPPSSLDGKPCCMCPAAGKAYRRKPEEGTT